MFERLKEIFNSVTEAHRATLEFGALQFNWHAIKDTLPKGDGHPVIFFPGFMTSDMFTLPLQNRVAERGYNVYGWDKGFNTGFDEETARHLKKRLHEVFEENGRQKVTLVGHSLGGVYARELAREFPHMVRQVITLGTPFGMLDDPAKGASRRLKDLYDYFNPTSVHTELPDIGPRGLTPPPVPCTSLYSKDDGVINWKAALNPKAPETENIEVYGSHLGMTFNPLTIAAVIDRLAQKEGEWKPFDRKKYTRLLYPAGKDADKGPENPEWKETKNTRSLFREDERKAKAKRPRKPRPPKAA